MRVIIIGNGIAGINVAAGVSQEPSALVTVYADESHAFYSRVRLPEVLSGSAPPEVISFYKPDWYEKRGISVCTGTRVVSIDRAERRVFFADGREDSYDFLVIATGASANHPSIPGANLPGIFTLRTMDDVAAIRANLAAYPDTASIIGGGLLGLEAARALKDAGAKGVRVFEIAPRLLPRQLDETGSALLRERFMSMGIDVVCGAETAAFDPAEANSGVGGGRAGFVRLKDGRSFPSDTTILSMGVHSNTELAKAASLAVNRGIIVDDHMRTDDSRIYAVGDCAEFGGIVWGIIPAALEQAPVAAKSILAASGNIPADEAPSYAQTVPKTALKVGSIEMMSLGAAVPTPDEITANEYQLVSKVWDDGARYERYVLSPSTAGSSAQVSESAILVGAILFGSKANQSRVQKMMGHAITKEEIDGLLA